MSERLTATTNVWLVAFFLSHGLQFSRAAFLPGPAGRIRFHFEDPDEVAEDLTRRFREDVVLQRYIDARHVVSGILDAVKRSGCMCDAEDVGHQIALIGAPRT